jgi:hypothetical protein
MLLVHARHNHVNHVMRAQGRKQTHSSSIGLQAHSYPLNHHNPSLVLLCPEFQTMRYAQALMVISYSTLGKKLDYFSFP